MADPSGDIRRLHAEARAIESAFTEKILANALRHRQHIQHLESPFGGDAFGRQAEKFARFFGTPKFIVGQTVVVVGWIVLNALAVVHHWDPYPFILLNLCFSTQAAYAAPLILLAQTRQADRDKAGAEADAHHREEVARNQAQLISADTALTRSVFELAGEILNGTRLLEEIHRHVTAISPLAGDFPPSDEGESDG